MKHILFILFTLLPMFVGSQNIAVKSFKKASNDMTARVTHPLTDQNGEKCALIKMVTTEKGFVFEGDMMGITKTEYKTGEYWIYLPNGARRITIKHNQLGILRNYVYPIPIKEAMVYIMELTTGKVVTTVVNAEIPMQWLALGSTPDGADLYLNDKLVGTTPFSKKLQVGEYRYRLEKYMYHNAAGIVNITKDKKVVQNIEMKPNFGYAKISTTPENGAKIEIDGKPLNGVTPFTTDRLLSGKHVVKVKMPMYSTKTVDLEITNGQTKDLVIPLDANFAEVTIETTPGADIYVDDEYKSTGTYTGRLMEGLHSISAKKSKYRTDKTQLQFKAGETKTIKLNPFPIIGKLDVTSTPFDAIITIDGKEYGKTPNTIDDLLVGDYKVTLTKQGYGTVTKTITIVETKTVTIDEVLPTGKAITLNSIPQGASIYVDGVAHDTTPLNITLGFGSHIVKLVNGENILEQTFNVSQTGKLVWNFNMNDRGIFTDKRDGETYRWVRIGNQVWMAENLRYASGKYVTSNSEWGDLRDNNYDAAYCWYDNNEVYKQKYGALYTYAAAKKACPDGCHLPSDAEWRQLEMHLGMSEREANSTGWRGTNEGTKLKSKSGWNNNGTDNYGFTALPGGYRYYIGSFSGVGYGGRWWSSTEVDSNYVYILGLYYDHADVGRRYYDKSDGFSVRCLRDSER